MKAFSGLWTWCGTLAAGLVIMMWIVAIGGGEGGLKLPFDPTRLTGSAEANAIITLAMVGILLHLVAYAWRGYQSSCGDRPPVPLFGFLGVDPDKIDHGALRVLWRRLSLIVCLILPVIGSLWLMWFVAKGDVYEAGVDTGRNALAHMLSFTWGGWNELRIGNPKGGEFFPLITDIVFLVVLAGYWRLAGPVRTMIRARRTKRVPLLTP